MSKEKLLASAQKSIEKGQIGKAIKDYQKIVETDPKDIRNRQKLAELLSREQMKDAALKEYEVVAKTYSDTGFYLKAIAVYKQMQRLDSGRPDIYQCLGELSEKQGLIGDAQAEYRNLSACYEKSRMFSEQLKVLRKMRELEPENLSIRVKIIDNLLLVDSAESARDELQPLLDELAAGGDVAKLSKLYDHFLPKFPDDLLLQAGHAELLIRQGEKNQGMQMLHDLLRKEPEHAGVLQVLAQVYRQEKKYQEEQLIYRRLLVRQPADLEFRELCLRAGINAGEMAAVRSELDAWQEDFSNAGRSELVHDLYALLDSSASSAPSDRTDKKKVAAEISAEIDFDDFLPDDEDIVETGSATDVIETVEDLEEITELEEIDELLEEVEELLEEEAEPPIADSESEEISLDFLEEAPLDFLEESTLPDASSPVPEGPTPIPPPVEMELDLELEMDVELDLDTDFELEEAADGAGEGEDALEIDFDDSSVEASAAEESRGEDCIDIGSVLAGAIDEQSAEDDFFDLGSDLDAELDDILPALVEETPIEAARPKKRVKTDVEVDDPESHYNLGIAYKEMGLLDDAIGEFDKAIFAPARAVPCLILKSLCQLEKGERQKAEDTLRSGLARTDVNEEGKISLHFELGDICESGNKLKEAYESFKYVADRDLFYREAGERVAALRQRLGLESDDGIGATAAGGRKNKVSYV